MSYDITSEERQQITAAAFRRYQILQRDECIDPFELDSRPTEKQGQVLKDIDTISHRYVVAANQVGKSAMGGREVSWIFEHKHPYWDTAKIYPDTPLLLLVIGRVSEQVETELWNKKIKPFLTPGSYKEVRIGNSLQRVIHKSNGNTIVFMSHHNVNEAREKAQSYTAHYVWLDEMPSSLSLIAELQLRVQAYQGRFLSTFTPLLRNQDIRTLVETAKQPVGKKYQFAMLDNPRYVGREEEILQQFESYPEAERRARLFGDWFVGDQAVYSFDFDTHTISTPSGYSPTAWRHVESVDPAASGKMGYSLLAEAPGTNIWFVVKTKYLDGAAASDLINSVKLESAGYNIVRRVSDPHEVWFIKEAAKSGLGYMGVFNKKNRKQELIKNLQQRLTDGTLKIGRKCKGLIQELTTCQWSENVEDKIVNSSSYHLLDSVQYAIDCLPRAKEVDRIVHPDPIVEHDMNIRRDNSKRKATEVKKKEQIKIKNKRRRTMWNRRRSVG